MKKTYLIILASILSISACKKIETPGPEAGFTLGNTSQSSIIFRQGTVIIPVNNSTNAVSYLWDFGNGKTSTERTPAISFEEGGEFNISLTVKNADGQISSTQRQVKVLTPFASQITITGLDQWKQNEFKFNGGDVWVEVYKTINPLTYQQILDRNFEFPVYFKSSVSTIPSAVSYPIVIDIPEKLSLEDKLGSKFRLVFALYVKDTSGTHVLFTSDFVGSSFFVDLNGGFKWTTTAGATVTFEGIYQ
ncbi:hypothetical protein DBR11_04940 [Pedobacter sp. HMWF019]|uniref:PKD domain-containing protein n=1 Tax=Pedobacter sp. HMWF019 TaxID=2056856 RepID=UPI000D3D0F31|nr:PKD domain-containing protein [Pedobacter sp. HMWF019]PTT02371.1 hypothetical protein DBR11_04940 [Pedobacter sp. HMWF019]